jgi:hypothetical protein
MAALVVLEPILLNVLYAGAERLAQTRELEDLLEAALPSALPLVFMARREITVARLRNPEMREPHHNRRGVIR